MKHLNMRPFLIVLVAAIVWLVAYNVIDPLAQFITYDLVRLEHGSRLGESVAFFLYDVPKILLLLAGMIFLISIVRTFFSPERTRALLGGKRQGIGNVLAAMLGIVTPFCSLLGGAAIHRLCRERHPVGSDILIPHRRPHDQRGCHHFAIRHVWLAGCRTLHRLRPAHRHRRRLHHR